MKNKILAFLKRIKNKTILEFKHIILWKYLVFPFGKKVFLIGTPEHGNIGDSAIAIAEKCFLEMFISSNRIKELTKNKYKEDQNFIKRHIKKTALICCHGGGNIGNQWYGEELFRYELLEDFKNNKIIVFPQTAFFTEDDAGQKALAISRQKYNVDIDLTITAREKGSFQFMINQYKYSHIILSPDIVLSSTIDDYFVRPQQRKGALLVFRDDIEKALDEETKIGIIELLKRNNITYKKTDTFSNEGVTVDTRLQRVKEKLTEFASAQIVITDRLHGMVFSAITETPCIVFSNYNHKVKGTYEWIKHLPYIQYVDSTDNIENIFDQLINLNNCKYDNKLILKEFSKLSEIINNYVN